MKTILFDIHQSLGAKIVNFSCWEMPLLYKSIIQEHIHTRNFSSIFDTCHMGEFEISGKTAASDLEKLLTQNISNMKIHSCSYGYLLNDNGGTIDDLICFRFAEDKFWLVVNAGCRQKDANWIKEHISQTTKFEDISDSIAKFDIQGPTSRIEIEEKLKIKLPNLNYFTFDFIELLGKKCVISRTGYTGEFGYEIFAQIDIGKKLWSLFTENTNIMPAGLGARDTLRVEAGLPLYGHELSEDHSPAGVLKARFVDIRKDFFGKERLQNDMNNPHLPILCGLKFDGRMAVRQGDKILIDDKEAGEVTSGLFSPSLSQAIALAFIHKDKCIYGNHVKVITKNKELIGSIESLPLYKNGTARKNL